MRAINVLAIVKPTERFVWLFDDTPESRDALLHALAVESGDKESSLTWDDVCVLADRVRRPMSVVVED